jgi:hypothetical protein
MNWFFSFRPRLGGTLKNHSADAFSPEFTAGLTAGTCAVPPPLAFASAL